MRYNFYPARLFLGDSGSLFLGFIMGILAMEMSTKRVMFVSMAVPLLILLIPLAGMIFTFTRRIVCAKNPFKPDNMHLHYRLIRAGMSHKNTVLLFYAVTFVYMIFGMVCYLLPSQLEVYILSAAVFILLFLYIWAMLFIHRKKARKGRNICMD